MSRVGILWIWLAIIVVLMIIYFFFPDLFHRIFHYSGAGSPYVNTPRG